MRRAYLSWWYLGPIKTRARLVEPPTCRTDTPEGFYANDMVHTTSLEDRYYISRGLPTKENIK